MESLKELTAKNTDLTSALRESIGYNSTARKGIKNNALEHAMWNCTSVYKCSRALRK
jgi:hypothetical protein